MAHLNLDSSDNAELFLLDECLQDYMGDASAKEKRFIFFYFPHKDVLPLPHGVIWHRRDE